MEPTDTATKSTSHRLKKALYKSGEKMIKSKSRLKFGGLVMLKEHDSGVDVVQGWFTEGGDSILGVLVLLRASVNEAVQDEQRVSWLPD